MSLYSFLSSILKKSGSFVPDKIYLKWQYYLNMKSRLDLKNPVKFSEKIQWLKLYDRNPFYTRLVDKSAVKEIVGEKIGFEYIIPTIGVWNTVEDIEWENLPNQFVLKTTHGGGGSGVIICRDKSKLNRIEAVNKLKQSLKSDIYQKYKEWPYKEVPRKIIAEKLISGGPNCELKDYKFFCFNGVPQFLKVDFGRFSEHHANYFDLNWNLLDYGEAAFPPVPEQTELVPENYDLMLEIVRILATNFPFIRIDLYNLNGQIFFGELTFYPSSGFTPWILKETDYEIGKKLDLSNHKQEYISNGYKSII